MVEGAFVPRQDPDAMRAVVACDDTPDLSCTIVGGGGHPAYGVAYSDAAACACNHRRETQFSHGLAHGGWGCAPASRRLAPCPWHEWVRHNFPQAANAGHTQAVHACVCPVEQRSRCSCVCMHASVPVTHIPILVPHG